MTFHDLLPALWAFLLFGSFAVRVKNLGELTQTTTWKPRT